MIRVVATGANGAVGQALIRALGRAQWLDVELVAVVRSERAAVELPALPSARGRVALARYEDAASLEAAFAGARALVHLPGVIVERPGATYEQANVATVRAAVEAAIRAKVGKVVLVSAHGADASSRNRYFRTKGEAEGRVRAAGLPFTILRAPLLLGPGTQEGLALRRAIERGRRWLPAGGRTLHQPLDVDDLAEACLRAATKRECGYGATLDLGGPELLRARDLVLRAAALAGRRLRVRSFPAALLRVLLRARRVLRASGPSPDFLEALLSDTRADADAPGALGLELTPLDATLRNCLRRETAS